MPGSLTSLQKRRGTKHCDIQVSQIALTSPGFQITQRFFTKELSFCINMSDLPVIQSSARTYIFVDALSAALGKMTTCLFFFFFSRAGAFSPILLRHGGGGGALLPFQCSFVALPVMCDPVLFDFICSLFITVIYCDLREQVRRLFGTTAWRNCLRQDSHSSGSTPTDGFSEIPEFTGETFGSFCAASSDFWASH